MWQEQEVKWCFCDFDLCNVNETHILTRGGKFPAAAPIQVGISAPKPVRRQRPIIRSRPYMVKPRKVVYIKHQKQAQKLDDRPYRIQQLGIRNDPTRQEHRAARVVVRYQSPRQQNRAAYHPRPILIGRKPNQVKPQVRYPPHFVPKSGGSQKAPTAYVYHVKQPEYNGEDVYQPQVQDPQNTNYVPVEIFYNQPSERYAVEGRKAKQLKPQRMNDIGRKTRYEHQPIETTLSPPRTTTDWTPQPTQPPHQPRWEPWVQPAIQRPIPRYVAPFTSVPTPKTDMVTTPPVIKDAPQNIHRLADNFPRYQDILGRKPKLSDLYANHRQQPVWYFTSTVKPNTKLVGVSAKDTITNHPSHKDAEDFWGNVPLSPDDAKNLLPGFFFPAKDKPAIGGEKEKESKFNVMTSPIINNDNDYYNDDVNNNNMHRYKLFIVYVT